MPTMLSTKTENSTFLPKITLFLLLMYEVRGYSQQWYKQPRWREVDAEATVNKSNVDEFSESSSKTFDAKEVKPVQPAHGSAPTVESGRESGSKIVFAESETDVRRAIGPVPICENATFCEDTPGYPVELVNREIERDPSLLKFAYVDAITNYMQKMDIPNEEPLCISTERVVYPKSAESANKTWLFVVNQPNFSQGVRIETCIEEDKSCKVIDGFAQGYITACKQKYIYRQLSAIASDGSVTREFFRFPASCCCHVQFVGALDESDTSFAARKHTMA